MAESIEPHYTEYRLFVLRGELIIDFKKRFKMFDSQSRLFINRASRTHRNLPVLNRRGIFLVDLEEAEGFKSALELRETVGLPLHITQMSINIIRAIASANILHVLLDDHVLEFFGEIPKQGLYGDSGGHEGKEQIPGGGLHHWDIL